MKPEKNTKKKKKNTTAKKFLKKTKSKKEIKYQDYAITNLHNINQLIKTHRTNDAEKLQQDICEFLNSIIQGKPCNLEFPAHIGPGLASLLLNNMSFWLGNTQETLKTKQFIDKLED